MPVRPFQTNFTAGELSHQLFARTDFAKYSNGAELLKNFVVLTQGGAARRAGTLFVSEVNDSEKRCKLLPFVFSQTQAYVLEFQGGDPGTLRFYRNRELIYGDPVGPNLVTNGDFATDLSSWTLSTSGSGAGSWDTGRAKINAGSAGAVTLAQAITVVPEMHYTWTFTQLSGGIGAQVGTANGLDDIRANEIVQGTRTLGFKVPAGVTTVWLQFGQLNSDSDQFIDNVSANLADPLVVESPYSEDELPAIRWCQSADVLYIFHPYYETRKLERISDTEWYLVPVAWNPPPSAELRQYPAAALTLGATTGTGITFTTDVDEFLAGDVNKMIQAGAGRAIITAVTDTKNVVVDIIDDFASTGPIAYGDWSWRGSPYADLDSDIRDPVNAIATLNATEPGAGTTPLASFRADDLGKFIRMFDGTLRIVEVTSATSVKAEILVPLDVADADPDECVAGNWTLEDKAWQGTTTRTKFQGFPGCGDFYEQRLFAGGTVGRPLSFWASVSADFENFTLGSDDDLALEYNIASGQVNQIRWIGGMKSLLMGSIGGEHLARGGTDSPITSSSIQVSPQTRYGSDYTLGPVLTGTAVLFLQRDKRHVRELAYNYEQDGWVAPDLTILADHLFQADIIDMARATSPNSYVFAVREDGALLVCAYERPENVVGWSRFITGPTQDLSDGKFENVCVIPNSCGTGDEVWVCVKRTLDSGDVRYIEVFDGTMQTDSGLKYSGDAINTLGGFSHLEGQVVWAIADGVAAQYTVADGEITLDSPASEVEVGLHYTSRLRTLRIEVPSQQGTTQGRRKRLVEIGVRVACCNGPINVKSGELAEEFTPDPDLIVQDFHKQGNLGWDREGRVTVEVTKPFGVFVLGIFGNVDVDEINAEPTQPFDQESGLWETNRPAAKRREDEQPQPLHLVDAVLLGNPADGEQQQPRRRR